MSNMLRFYFSMFLELKRKFSFLDRHYLSFYKTPHLSIKKAG